MLGFAQMVISGLAMGSIYALVALGIVLIWNAAKIVNFAQGEFLMIGAYIYVGTAVASLHLPFWWALLVAVIGMTIIGVASAAVVYYPLRNKPDLTVICSTIGLSVFLMNIAQLIWGPSPRFDPGLFHGKILALGKLTVPYQNIFILVVAVILLVLQWLFFQKTWMGKSMRAVAQDKSTASLMGISVNKVIAITFGFASALASIAGVLLVPVFFATLNMGGMVGLKGFAASIIGGFGNISGAIIGGLIIGVLEILGTGLISAEYRDAICFILLIVILLVRPQGLLGEPNTDRA